MSFLFRLIGNPVDTIRYEIKYNLRNSMTLKLLYDLFNFLGLEFDDLENIKFIIDEEQIKEGDEYFISRDNDRCIYIYTLDDHIKLNLITIFRKEGTAYRIKTQDDEEHNEHEEHEEHDECSRYHYDTENDTSNDTDTSNETDDKESDDEIDSYISGSITQVPSGPELAPIMTPDIIVMTNMKVMSLFSDPDFKNLIRIYMNKPELFKIFAKYIQHGDIIANDQIVKTIEDLDETELIHYQYLADQIHGLGLELPNDFIINHLIKYSGHLNLTVRSLLSSINS